MSEIDNAAGATPDAGDVDESSGPGGANFGLGDEPGLEVIEGLAEEEHDERSARGGRLGNDQAAALPRDDAAMCAMP